MADVDARTVRPLAGAPAASLPFSKLPAKQFGPRRFCSFGGVIDAFADVYANLSQRSPDCLPADQAEQSGQMEQAEQAEESRQDDAPGATPANADLPQSSRQPFLQIQGVHPEQDPAFETSIERGAGNQAEAGTLDHVEDPIVNDVQTVANAEHPLKASARPTANDRDGQFDPGSTNRPCPTDCESESTRFIDDRRSAVSQVDSQPAVTQKQPQPESALPQNQLINSVDSADSEEDQSLPDLRSQTLESRRQRHRSQDHGAAAQTHREGTHTQAAGTQTSQAEPQATIPADLCSNAHQALRLAGSAAGLTAAAAAIDHGGLVKVDTTLQNLQHVGSWFDRMRVHANGAHVGKAVDKGTSPSIAITPGAVLPLANSSAVAPAEKASTSDLLNRVKLIQRVSKAFQRLGADGGTVRLRLSPAELGSVRVEMHVRDRVIQARVVAETEAASAAIREHLPELRSRLESYGMQVEKMEVETEQADPGFAAGGDNESPWNSPQQERRLQGRVTPGSARQGSASDSELEAGTPRRGLNPGEPGRGVDVHL